MKLSAKFRSFYAFVAYSNLYRNVSKCARNWKIKGNMKLEKSGKRR